MPNRVPPHRRAYLHEKPPLILLVFLGMFAALLPAVTELPLRPIDPEIIPVPDQNAAGFLLARSGHLHPGVIRLLEPDPISGCGQKPPFIFPRGDRKST